MFQLLMVKMDEGNTSLSLQFKTLSNQVEIGNKEEVQGIRQEIEEV